MSRGGNYCVFTSFRDRDGRFLNLRAQLDSLLEGAKLYFHLTESDYIKLQARLTKEWRLLFEKSKPNSYYRLHIEAPKNMLSRQNSLSDSELKVWGKSHLYKSVGVCSKKICTTQFSDWPGIGEGKIKLDQYSLISWYLRQAKSLGFDDFIKIDPWGNILEASTSNIFFVQGNQVVTPTEGAFYRGVTRLSLIEAFKESGYELKETSVELKNLNQFSSAFLTNSVQGIIPVKGINSHEFVNSELDAILRLFDSLWRDYENSKMP